MMKRFIYENDKGIYLQDVLVVTIFHRQLSPKAAKSLQQILALYLSWVPSDKITHHMGIHSEELKLIKASTIKRYSAKLDSSSIKGKFFGFTLQTNNLNAPEYSISIMQKDDYVNKEDSEDVNYIEMIFPSNTIESDRFPEWIDLIRQCFASIKYISGYASMGLNLCTECGTSNYCEYLPGLAFRYHGLDIYSNLCAEIGNKSRGARWLTFVGQELIDTLGGIENIKQALSEQVKVKPAGTGFLLRASKYPELGDVNRGVEPKGLKEIAHIIEPITFFGETSLEGMLDCEWKSTKYLQWERRFLDKNISLLKIKKDMR